MKRSGFTQSPVEPRPCTGPDCVRTFIPFRPMQTVCGPVCARRKVEAAKKQERAQDRAKRASFERIPDLIAAADKEFASYIRERDRQAGYACISSGRPLDWTGNQVDAGHYRSRGAASHLRYNEDNCHAQSKHDNRHLGGNIVQYRINLIARIGLARVEALEADNTPHKWTHDELRAIRDQYKAKAKVLKREAAL